MITTIALFTEIASNRLHAARMRNTLTLRRKIFIKTAGWNVSTVVQSFVQFDPEEWKCARTQRKEDHPNCFYSC